MKSCCEKFAAHVAESLPVGTVEFTKARDNTWRIVGCCGGCYVVSAMRFCPYCGDKIDGGSDEAS